jgi:hypothetical protein
MEVEMTTFDKREQGEEGHFAHQAEVEFRIRARRDKLVGLWAAEKLGMQGSDAAAYAQALVAKDFEEHGDGDVIAKLKADFSEKSVAVSDHQIERTLAEKMAEARAQIKAE